MSKKTKPSKEERKEPTPLTPIPQLERGTVGLKNLSLADGDIVDEPREPSPNILDSIMARLIKPKAFAEPVLALEILRGPYTGIVFSFKTFEVSNTMMENGMRGTTYETQIYHLPTRFGADWVQDEGFDRFTSEVLFSWLSYVQLNSLAPLLKAKPEGGIQ